MTDTTKPLTIERARKISDCYKNLVALGCDNELILWERNWFRFLLAEHDRAEERGWQQAMAAASNEVEELRELQVDLRERAKERGVDQERPSARAAQCDVIVAHLRDLQPDHGESLSERDEGIRRDAARKCAKIAETPSSCQYVSDGQSYCYCHVAVAAAIRERFGL